MIGPLLQISRASTRQSTGYFAKYVHDSANRPGYAPNASAAAVSEMNAGGSRSYGEHRHRSRVTQRTQKL